MPSISGIHHVALTVRDLVVSEDFYSRLWGVGPVGTLSLDGFERRIFRPAAGLTIGLTQHDDGSAAEFSPLVAGLDHIGFACDDTAAIEEWVKHLDGVGIAHGPIQKLDFGTALVVKDPDGIALEFYLSATPKGI